MSVSSTKFLLFSEQDPEFLSFTFPSMGLGLDKVSETVVDNKRTTEQSLMRYRLQSFKRTLPFTTNGRNPGGEHESLPTPGEKRVLT